VWLLEDLSLAGHFQSILQVKTFIKREKRHVLPCRRNNLDICGGWEIRLKVSYKRELIGYPRDDKVGPTEYGKYVKRDDEI